MSETLIPVPEEWKKRTFMTRGQYEGAYADSIRDPEGYWGKAAERLDWIKPRSQPWISTTGARSAARSPTSADISSPKDRQASI